MLHTKYNNIQNCGSPICRRRACKWRRNTIPEKMIAERENISGESRANLLHTRTFYLGASSCCCSPCRTRVSQTSTPLQSCVVVVLRACVRITRFILYPFAHFFVLMIFWMKECAISDSPLLHRPCSRRRDVNVGNGIEMREREREVYSTKRTQDNKGEARNISEAKYNTSRSTNIVDTRLYAVRNSLRVLVAAARREMHVGRRQGRVGARHGEGRRYGGYARSAGRWEGWLSWRCSGRLDGGGTRV